MATIVGKVLTNRREGNVRFVLDADVENTLRDDLDQVASLVRRAIRRSPYWPVRTGRSRAAFRVVVRGLQMLVTNRYRYAYIVEATYQTPRHPITETISGAIERDQRTS